MPKAILEFQLPEEEQDHKLATRGSEYFCVLHDIRNELRNWWKYDQDKEQVLERIKELINDAPMDDIS